MSVAVQEVQMFRVQRLRGLKKIGREKMKKQKYDLEKQLFEYSARIIKKIHSQNMHLP